MRGSQTLPALLLGALMLIAGCLEPEAPATPRPAFTAPVPSPPGKLRPPEQAILGDQVVGSPRRAATDHLGPLQAAADRGDPGPSLQEYTAWGWLEASTRSWDGAAEILVRTIRPEGASRAFAVWAGEAARAPSLAGPCPAAVQGLAECTIGVASDRAVAVGRRDAEVFRIECPAALAGRLAAAQAVALRG